VLIVLAALALLAWKLGFLPSIIDMLKRSDRVLGSSDRVLDADDQHNSSGKVLSVEADDNKQETF